MQRRLAGEVESARKSESSGVRGAAWGRCDRLAACVCVHELSRIAACFGAELWRHEGLVPLSSSVKEREEGRWEEEGGTAISSSSVCSSSPPSSVWVVRQGGPLHHPHLRRTSATREHSGVCLRSKAGWSSDGQARVARPKQALRRRATPEQATPRRHKANAHTHRQGGQVKHTKGPWMSSLLIKTAPHTQRTSQQELLHAARGPTPRAITSAFHAAAPCMAP